MVMIRDGGSEEGGEGAHIYCRGMGGGCNVKTDRDGSESDANGGRVCVCLQSEMKYETQKQHTQKKQEENGSRVLSSNQISSSSSAGRPPLPSLPPPPSWVPLSLYPSLSGILSPPPLRASCRGSWFAPPCLGLSESCERLLFRSVTADREQLTQGQGGE